MAPVMALPTAEWHVLIFLWPTAPQGSFHRALNLSTSLVDSGNFAEARAFMPDQMTLAKRVFGSDHRTTLDFQWGWARAFTCDKDASSEQLAEAVAILEKALKTAQRVLGREHPGTCNYLGELAIARKLIALKGA